MTSDVGLSRRATLRHEAFGAWCGPIFCVLTLIGFIGFAHFYDPAAAHLAPSELAAFYRRHDLAVEFGMSLVCLATAFLALYSVELGIVLWRRERTPLMALGEVLGGFGVVMLIFISCCLWIGAAYRAGDANPDVTVALNDSAWFGFLVGWVMLALQMATTGVVTLREHGPDALAPRWVSWASIAGAVALATANGCAFTKTGPFAWDGSLGYYLPMAIWGIWLNGHAYLILRDLRRRAQLEVAGLELGLRLERDQVGIGV